MSRFLVYCLPVPGHAFPMLEVARGLVSHGNEVVVYTGKRFESRVHDIGARYIPIPPGGDFDYERIQERFPDLKGRTGLSSLKCYIKQVFMDPIPEQVRFIRPFVEEFRPAVVLTDPTVGPAKSLSMMVGMPWAVLSIVPISLSSRDTAPFGTGLSPSQSALGRLRNRFLSLLFATLLLRDVWRHDVLIRRQLGFKPGPKNLMDAPLSPFLYLQTTVPSFEYPRTDLAPQVHFVGPVIPRQAHEQGLPVWWDDLKSGRKVVLVSQGTIATHHEDLLVPTINGLAETEYLVVAITGKTFPESMTGGKIPRNVRLAEFIPYDQLLPFVDVMITNGGYGGVQQALANGIPLVGAGDTEEKTEICNRIEWSGVGISLRTRSPSSRMIRDSVDRVLGQARFRETARRFQIECGAYPGAELAVRLLETLARTQSPVVRS